MTVNIFLLLALCVISGLAVAQWAIKKGTEIEDRRRGAAKLASVLTGYGLKKTPEFLIDYSVGDYSGMAVKIKQLAELFLDGEDAVVAEFKQIFESCLNARLKDESGRAYVAARLVDAKLDSDPSLVEQAPKPAVK